MSDTNLIDLLSQARAATESLEAVERIHGRELSTVDPNLKPEVRDHLRGRIVQRAEAKAAPHLATLDRAESRAAEAAKSAEPETLLRRAKFEDSSAELAYRRRLERADAATLRAFATDARDESDLARLAAVLEEARARKDGAALAEEVRQVAHAAAQRSTRDPERAAEVSDLARRGRNALARVAGRPVRYTPEELGSMPMSEYRKLRTAGLIDTSGG